VTGTLSPPASAKAAAPAGAGGTVPGKPWVWGLALVALTIVTRLPVLAHQRPFNDEGMYSLVAIEILEGGKPYVDAVDRKPPLLFWTYAAILGVVGRYNVFGLHAAAVAWVLLTMAGLYAVGRALFDRTTGFLAALLYSVYQPWLFHENLAFNGEVLMNLPLVWALFLAVRPTTSRLRPELVLAGVLLCLAFLLKQPAAIAALPVGLYLLLPSYRASRGLKMRYSLLHAVWLTAGFFGTLGLVALVLNAQGILQEAYYWTISNHDLPLTRWTKGLLMSLAFAVLAWPMVWGSLISLSELRGGERVAGRWGGRHAELLALAILLVASCIAVVSTGRFYQHYYIQLIPPLALLSAPVWAEVLGRSVVPPHRWFSRHTLLAWLGTSLLVSLVSHAVGLARERDFSEVGRFIQARSTPDDRIYVWGQRVGIYLAAQRRPASRYATNFPLTGHVFGGPRNAPVPDTRRRVLDGAWETFEREITARPPRFIVDDEVIRPPHQRYAIEDFPVVRRLVERNYRLVLRAKAGWVYERIGSPTS
jgi:4-amino-4-deoxy-L-arabinose transferase-like glycosyltransferase